MFEPDLLNVSHVLEVDLVTVTNPREPSLDSICDRLNALYCSPFCRIGGVFVPLDALRNVSDIHQ